MSNSPDWIVVVEDEDVLGEGLQFNFEAEGHRVRWFRTGDEAMLFIEGHHHEIAVVLLDLMLPGMDGFEVLQRTKALAERVPIVVLSAKSMESDKVRALGLGADDYVTKPFSLAELLLRVKGLVRRSSWYKSHSQSASYRFGPVTIFPERLILEKENGEHVRLSPMEGLLLQTFHENQNRVLSRGELLEKVWNQERTVNTRTVDVFLSKLRKYVEVDPARPLYLLSVRSVGYAYVTDPKTREDLLL